MCLLLAGSRFLPDVFFYLYIAIYSISIVSACLIVFIFGLCDNRKERILQQILHWPTRRNERNAHKIVKKDNGINVNFLVVSRHMAQRRNNNFFFWKSCTEHKIEISDNKLKYVSVGTRNYSFELLLHLI